MDSAGDRFIITYGHCVSVADTAIDVRHHHCAVDVLIMLASGHRVTRVGIVAVTGDTGGHITPGRADITHVARIMAVGVGAGLVSVIDRGTVDTVIGIEDRDVD